MQALNIRNVPDEIVAAMKRRAKAHHRSLQGELVATLEEAARRAPPAERPEPLKLVLSKAHSRGTWSREDLYDDGGR